jgi:hypothetical protein
MSIEIKFHHKQTMTPILLNLSSTDEKEEERILDFQLCNYLKLDKIMFKLYSNFHLQSALLHIYHTRWMQNTYWHTLKLTTSKNS